MTLVAAKGTRAVARVLLVLANRVVLPTPHVLLPPLPYNSYPLALPRYLSIINSHIRGIPDVLSELLSWHPNQT